MWRDDRGALRPAVLLGRLRRLRENAELAKVPDVQYTHLNASLADGPIGSDGLQLRVLRSSRHVWQVGKNRSTSIGLAQLATGLPLAAHYICTCIYQVGKKLCNCATMYSSRVGEEKYVLVALEHANNATPVALGGYVVGSGRWEQAQSLLPHRCALSLTDQLLSRSTTCPTPHAHRSSACPTGGLTTRHACGSESTCRRSTRSLPSARSSSAVMRRTRSLSLSSLLSGSAPNAGARSIGC